MKKVFFIPAILLALSSNLQADELRSTLSDQQSVAMTVYNSDLGLVKDLRKVKIPTGTHELQFMDVASQINPVTVHIKSLSDPTALTVLEQNYEYDLLSPQKLMDKFVGRKVKFLYNNPYTDKKEITDAELLSNNNGAVYRINNEIRINPPGDIIFSDLPENLIAKPTLIWLLDNQNKNEQQIEVSYLTSGINWKADYIAVLSEDNKLADLSGWVTINNKSGAQYKDAKLKLVAGDVNRVREELGRPVNRMDMMMAGSFKSKESFKEESFFEYHLYTLDRPSTIKDNQTKQIELISAANIPVNERLMYYGNRNYYRNQMSGEMISNQKIGVYIEIENKKERNLGIPLPKGIVRAYKKDKEAALQFIGEDQIDHTPKDEKFKIKMGDAFDVVGERKQTDYKILTKNAMQRFDVEQEWEVTVRNHKEMPVTVEVIEPLYADWDMINSTHPFEKIEAHTIKFVLKLGKDKSDTIKYRVKIRWW